MAETSANIAGYSGDNNAVRADMRTEDFGFSHPNGAFHGGCARRRQRGRQARHLRVTAGDFCIRCERCAKGSVDDAPAATCIVWARWLKHLQA
ncbi:hypothetical protein IOCL2690_000131500 [Leishmania lindenbergi]|uniref:Uncharacterized protein n=1 Tax=Leishmania lindenbergi TaxID=651832 RepID=A0AAW3AX31_9TRYP